MLQRCIIYMMEITLKPSKKHIYSHITIFAFIFKWYFAFTWQFFTRKWQNTKWLDLKLYGILLGCYGLLWEGRRLDQTTVFRSQVKSHGHWSMVMLSFVVLVLVSLYSEALSVTWQNKSKLNSWKYKCAKS